MKIRLDNWQCYCYGLAALVLCASGSAIGQDSDQLALPPRKNAVATASAGSATNSSAIQRIERSFSFYTHQEQQKKAADTNRPEAAPARSSATSSEAPRSSDAGDRPAVKSVLVKKSTGSASTEAASKPVATPSREKSQPAASTRSVAGTTKDSSTGTEKSAGRAAEKRSTAAVKTSSALSSDKKSDTPSVAVAADKPATRRGDDAPARSASAEVERGAAATAATQTADADTRSSRHHDDEPVIAPEEVSSMSPAQSREYAMVPGPVSSGGGESRAPITAPATTRTNVYLPQDTGRNRNLLSRILRREPAAQTQSVAYAPINFTSDYTKRGSDVLLPSVIRGNGINGRDIPIGLEDQFRFSTMPDDFRPTDLVELPRDLCHYNNQLYLRSEAANALCRMVNDAARQGLNIEVVSAFRDYQHQLRLYNQAVARRGPNQKMVARPGRSEHQLGTTVDVTNSREHSLKRSFGNTAEGRWLAANAERYGWKLTVMSAEGNKSTDEPWHLRYLGNQVSNYSKNRAIAQNRAAQPAQPQKRGLFTSVGRFFGSNRR